MMAYLVYVVIYNYFVNELPIKRDIDVSHEPIQLWYPTMWMHKALFYIDQIHDLFLRRCKEIFTREIPELIM